MRLQHDGHLEQAKDVYRRILKSNPRHPDALHLYGLACHQQGDQQTAIEYIQKAIDQVPGQAVLRNNLANALRVCGHFAEARVQLDIALNLRPDYAGAQQNLGAVCAKLGDHDAALRHARKAVQLDADQPAAWFDLGLIQLEHCLLADAVQSFRKSLALRPKHPRVATSLLYTLNLLPDIGQAEVAEEHARVMSGLFGDISRYENYEQPSGHQTEAIRLGYMSADFCQHAVNYFFEPVLKHQDKREFVTFCYSDVTKPDGTTHRLQQYADHWRDISSWDDQAVAGKVRSDRIDILIDLAGHTKGNRLGVFARKPANCQLSWLGYPNTTGLTSMDYRIVDQYTVADINSYTGTESLLRLERGFACFQPPAYVTDVSPLPAIKKNVVTLGSLHKLEKLNDPVISLWARILQENPGSRLMLLRDQLDDWQQHRLQSMFAGHGIGKERLKMIHFVDSVQDFFTVFADIDILLDTFPWGGHTLACCGLWMGVPVVTLSGAGHAGRMVASVLNLLGLDELIAPDKDSYARIVHDLCADKTRLAGYRCGLRKRFERSPLRDEAAFTKGLEAQFKQILSF